MNTSNADLTQKGRLANDSYKNKSRFPYLRSCAIRYATDIEVLRKQVLVEVLRKQVLVETYRSRGPGGQHKNKAETAVRLTHLPSGIVVVATEHRSQIQNRRLALERLRKRLIQLSRPRKHRIATRPPARAVEKRMETKKKSSERKSLRKKVFWDKDSGDIP